MFLWRLINRLIVILCTVILPVPQGVLYSHRSNYLHGLIGLQEDMVGLKSSSSVLVGMKTENRREGGWERGDRGGDRTMEFVSCCCD